MEGGGELADDAFEDADSGVWGVLGEAVEGGAGEQEDARGRDRLEGGLAIAGARERGEAESGGRLDATQIADPLVRALERAVDEQDRAVGFAAFEAQHLADAQRLLLDDSGEDALLRFAEIREQRKARPIDCAHGITRESIVRSSGSGSRSPSRWSKNSEASLSTESFS